ncbi:hypothetical protein SteCoe_36667 [Stentor coeruleus]|uniref:Uncharacterized protein n=1 Tax=Stentor coeruleus TaxID=5963 RepID=A0A1R2APK4_9CILI|nr:hypothetical protein SteCoe_36667 [Stentor coeruleus]
MAFNCCSNCLPLLLEYHSTSLDLERKLQMQKIELSKLQFEKQIRDLASLSFSQVTAPETPNSKINFHSLSESSASETELKHSLSPLQVIPVIQKPDTSLDLHLEKELLLKNSLNELKSSLNSLVSSTELFKSSVETLKKSSDWAYSDSQKLKEDSLFTFQEGFNNMYLEPGQRPFDETKKSSLMSPLRESDLKNSKELSSGITVKSIEKLPGTPVSDLLGSSNKPSSSFNKAFLTLDELQGSSGRRNLFDHK